MSATNVKLDRPLDRRLTGVTVIHHSSNATQSTAAPTVIPAGHQATDVDSELMANIFSSIEKAHLQTSDAISGLSELAVRFAMAITAKVIGTTEGLEQKRIELMLNEALLRPEPAVAIFVHPNRVTAIREALAEQLSAGKTRVEADPEVPAAECRVEFASHDLVSNLTHQFAQIEIEILDIIGHARL